jgi:transcriptional regulator with XRE-family HTH domain
MTDLHAIGEQIAANRKKMGLTQTALSHRVGVSRATLDALENGRSGQIGFSIVSRLLAAVGLELTLQPTPSTRPTLDELRAEDRSQDDHDD